MDRRARKGWWATVHEVTKSWTQVSNFQFHCFLFRGERFQPPRPSLSSKGQIQTISK